MNEFLQRDIAWLHGLLDEVAPPSDAERIAREAAAGIEGGAALGALSGLSLDAIRFVLKRITMRFHLRNKAEQHHIVRVNRVRAARATQDAPRAESIAEAVGALRSGGVSFGDLEALLGSLDIQPTLTAHPTEVRRRAILQKQRSIGACLEAIDGEGQSAAERRRIESRVRQTMSLQLATDEVRALRLDVADEVRNGVLHLAGVIWDAVPLIHRDVVEAVQESYGRRVSSPSMVRYRTWIGGDRDGNPNVTASVTASALETMRAAAVSRWHGALGELHQELSISDRRAPILPELLEDLERERAELSLPEELVRHHAHEPLRAKVLHMQRKLGVTGAGRYTTGGLIADLGLLGRALHHAGLAEVADESMIVDLQVQARAFGLHLAALDIRQHSAVHEGAVAELLRIAGVEPEYSALDEAQRVGLLERELETDRPLLGRGTEVSARTREALDVLGLVARVRREAPDSIGSYVISMTHGVSDLLEVLVLMREAGLWRCGGAQPESALDVAPLFETVADLEVSARLLSGMFGSAAYGAQLRARGGFQEIMLGYSDSNKDGGTCAANWRLYRAQRELALACRGAGVDLRFFHGRGGSVARGGGRAQRAILAAPPESWSGRIRFTEQGEVITFRYAMAALARRHLEQIVGAVLTSAARCEAGASEDHDALERAMDELSVRSMRAYRDLIDGAGFWEWFVARSPVGHIGEMPIASRPVTRSGTELTFDSLRAIPWVFSWTQMRVNVPGWYGVGSAIEGHAAGEPGAMGVWQRAYMAGGFFREYIDNVQQEMARARLPVARLYMDGAGAGISDRIGEEYDRTRRAVLQITGQMELLDNNPVIQESIRQRNPDTDVLNALQVELLRRFRDEPSEELHQLILLSVNGLAAAMQSTG